MLFGFPHAINNILDGQNEIRLAVSGVTEWHVRRVSLRNWGQSQMRWPGLDENHVASDQASSIGTASRVRLAVKHYRTITVCGVPKDLVEMHRKAVEVTNVVRAKVCMKCIVEQGILYRKVHGAAALASGGTGVGSRGALAGGLGLLQREGKRCSRVWRGVVGGKVQTIWMC